MSTRGGRAARVVAVVVVAGLLAGVVQPARAVHDTGVFELDGDSAVNAPPADDFDTIFAGPGSSLNRTFASDHPEPTNLAPDTTIHEGGDKDFDPVSAWGCVSKSNPVGKLDVRYAYAAVYEINGDIHAFFGLNRAVNTGDASVGFWFFQENVGCDAVATGGVFTGRKTHGDLFVISEFSNGGTVQTVNLYRWTDLTPAAPESGDETLDLIVSGADCKAADPHLASALVCGTQNTAPITVAWEPAPVDGFNFFEGGINISQLLAQLSAQTCFVSFQAKSRSSTSLDSDLEDFVGGRLQNCASLAVTKVTNPPADPQSFSFSVTGGPGSIAEAFALADGGSEEVSGLDPGTYQITETVPPGWTLEATCTGGPFGTGASYANGADIVLPRAVPIECTFANTNQATGLSTVTVDQVTVGPAGAAGTLFTFTVSGGAGVSDTFQLADATPPHTTDALLPGTYRLDQAKPAGWDVVLTCSGGPFGAGAPYTSGTAFTLAAGDAVTCTSTATLRQAAAGQFCPGPSQFKILNQRYPGQGMDLVVRTDLGESIQDAIDAAIDYDGDGQILVGVSGNAFNRPGGHTAQQIAIDRVFPAPFALIGCSVTLHDPIPGDGVPSARITAAAGPAIFVMGIYAEDSGAEGWLVEGDGRFLYSVSAARNALGIRIAGNANVVELGQFRANAGNGVEVTGSGNRLIGISAVQNGGHGIRLSGNGHQVVDSLAGNRTLGNGLDGIHAAGAGLLLQRNRVFANAGDGIEVRGSTAASPNVIQRNIVGDYAKGNGGVGILVDDSTGNGVLDPVEIDANMVRNNGAEGILLTGAATGHELRRNFVGGTSIQDNGGCEFSVAAGNFNAMRNTANRAPVPGRDGTPFPTACLGSP